MAQPQTASDRALGAARRAFFEHGGAPVGKVPDTILRSWVRCQRLGLPAQGAPQIEPVSAARLRELREGHERLWRLARAELELLSSDAAATGSIVILTDEDGWILDAEGSASFLDRAGRVALMPGACWNEAQVGTNAIGTAIVEGRPVVVHGGEHYLAPHGILSCSATPIFDPYGTRIGVLDISGDARVSHMHALGLARMAVASIEHRYFDDGIPDAELLRLHRDPALLGTAREGLLAFRNGKLVAANQAGLQLFGLERGELGRASYTGLFADALTRLRDDGVLLDRQGRALHGRVEDGQARPRRPAARPPITVSAAVDPQASDAPLFDAGQDACLARARRVLDAGLPVLVQGQTGTGKEVFARELHRRCARAGRPFVAVNCAALPEGLIEAELFGYEDGAFTGARKHGNPGLLRQADGGVLFLDEIGDMPLALQARLLRVLQSREVSPLGAARPVAVDFALVCATHRALAHDGPDAPVRPDLYFRIAEYTVTLAPLRARPDLRELLRTLWAAQGSGPALPGGIEDALAQYAWPGNYRQMAAVLRTLHVLAGASGRVDEEMLPADIRGMPAAQAAAGAASLQAMADDAIRAALAAHAGNVSAAARALGVHRSTLYRRAAALGLARPG